ncbi:MAG: nuclear transport factor 2 family protein [Cytophagales bacterium]|nr:nuclear transport factor 2 family protein [Cytophagales bacterium]
MEKVIQDLIDKEAIIRTINGYVETADRKEWEKCEALFTEDVTLHHITETNPDEAQTEESEVVKASDLMQQWSNLFDKFNATMHMVTNHNVTINGDEAICESYVNAIHIAKAALNAERHHLSFGMYKHKLVRKEGVWRISEVNYDQIYALGNTAIF